MFGLFTIASTEVTACGQQRYIPSSHSEVAAKCSVGRGGTPALNVKAIILGLFMY